MFRHHRKKSLFWLVAGATLCVMGRIYNKDSRLESHRLFPYIAWATVFVFAFFVYSLTKNLQAAASDLHLRTSALEIKVSQQVSDIENFE